MRNINFRKGRREDFSNLATIISNNRAWTCFGIDYEEGIRLFEEMEDEIYIAEEEGEFLALGTLRINGLANMGAYIRMLIVKEEFRGEGIGAKMIEYLNKIASQQVPNTFLICSVENKKAQKFYEKLGFKQVGIMKDLVINGHDEILYRKKFRTLY